MKTHLSIAVICFVFASAIIVTPGYLRTEFFAPAGATSAAPIANNDTFQVHGATQLTNLLANDNDPDGEGFSFESYGALPQHGSLSGPNLAAPRYSPSSGFVGTDSFTYQICDTTNSCSNFATVTLNVVNQAPTPGSDSFTVHGTTQLGNLLVNDTDPDGDNIVFRSIQTFPQHGILQNANLQFPAYSPSSGYTGPDSFVYRVCDSLGLCTNSTVSLNVVNNAPTPGDDSFTVHGTTQLGNLMANDSDPDNDTISFRSIQTSPQHGILQNANLQFPAYSPHSGYTGPDSFTYRICDQLGLCTNATVTLNVVNNAPTPVDDMFTVRGLTPLGNLMVNDTDPDGDPKFFQSIQTSPQHGILQNPNLLSLAYSPHSGYTGSDSFTYRICDNLGLCANATVTLFIIGDGENNGKNSCQSVGKPVNVTNGNMYVQQNDYVLPGLGFPIQITRTYNSQSQRIGLFGRGWSTAFDSAILAYDNSLARLNEEDGRATYFGRAVGSSGVYGTIEADFHGQLSKTASGFTVSLVDGSSSHFNSAGKLLTLSDRKGNATTLTYGSNGILATITDAFGRVLNLTTNSTGQVVSLSDTMGTIATYAYGANSQLVSVTYADNSAFHFSYDGGLRLTNVTDALGNVLESHIYDSQGRALTSEKHGGVERYTLSYLSSTQTDVTDALGRVTKYTLDKSKGRNLVTKVEGLCNCGGGSQVQISSYDSQLNLISTTDALGQVTSYTYDGDGNTLTRTDTTGTVTYTYNQFGEGLTRTDQLNGVATNTYDASGNLLTTSDPLNNATTFGYNARGQILTATDARGKVTTFTYDMVGNLVQRRDANNITTFYFYDARGRLTKIRDGLSRSTLYAYDPVGRLIKVTHPDLSFITLTYDLAGRRTIATDERGNPTSFTYDNAYRLITITNALGHATTNSYDAMSNLISTRDALARVTDYEYDDFNRLKKTLYPPAIPGGARLFQSMTYDAAGNVKQQTDTAGRVTTYAYDSANRLSSTTDADNRVTSFEYDVLSRTTTVIDPLNQHYEFAYDAAGRQTGVSRAGVSMAYQYDAVGNLTQRTDYKGMTTNYAYDNLNRLITIAYPTRTATYSYDPLSNLTRATNENGSVYIGYDNRYRVSSFSDPFYYGISYNYDTAGNRTKLKLNGATFATYTYDAVNRLTNLADSTNQNFPHSYDAVNRLIARSAPNGVTSTYAYDGLSRLTALNHVAGATTVLANQYTYNDANNISNWTNASGHHAYAYDSVDRLTSTANIGQPNENYSYDAVGNRTASHLSASYGYQPFNKLSSTATGAYTYDSNGNLIAKTDALGTTSFTWTEEGQLTQVALPTGLTISYKYDALGRRIQRITSAGSDERYVYDGQNVLLDLNADWSIANKYLSGPGMDNHLRQTSSINGVQYFLTDHLGSTAALTDASGGVLEHVAYDSFGNSAGSSRTRYGFTGRERDPDTGLLYYRARFYDPQVGRFLSEDPIGLTDGPNPYAYVGNNVTNATDPQGLFGSRGPWKIHQAIIRGALSGLGISASDMRMLIREQKIFDQNTQGEQFAHVHAMTRRGERPEDARRKANQFVRFNICMARRLAAQGKRSAAMVYLSHAMHTLQDAASPAHANFAVAWTNTLGQTVDHAPHYASEIFDPGPGSVSYESTVNVWKYFTGELAMPDDFFPNMFDRKDGRRGHFRRWSSPDYTSCDCY